MPIGFAVSLRPRPLQHKGRARLRRQADGDSPMAEKPDTTKPDLEQDADTHDSKHGGSEAKDAYKEMVRESEKKDK